MICRRDLIFYRLCCILNEINMQNIREQEKGGMRRQYMPVYTLQEKEGYVF